MISTDFGFPGKCICFVLTDCVNRCSEQALRLSIAYVGKTRIPMPA